MILTKEQEEKANIYLREYVRLYKEYGQEMRDAGTSEDMIDRELHELIKKEIGCDCD